MNSLFYRKEQSFMRFKKRLFICLIISTLLFLCGCNKEKTFEPSVEEYDNQKLMYEKKLIEDASMGSFGSLTCMGNNIYVVCTGSNCILKYSKEGQLVDTFGRVGKGEGEFSKPIAICNFDNEIYVMDENDGRIQVFDENGKFIKKYNVEELESPYVSVVDLEANEEKIYVSVVGCEKKSLKIYDIDKSNGKVSKIGDMAMGALGKDEKNIYFAKAFDFFKEKNSSGYRDGESYIASVTDKDVVKHFQLPDTYSPADIAVFNHQMYVFSRAYTQIDVFEMDGSYVETVFSEKSTENNRGLGYMAMDEDGSIYLADKEKSAVYKLENQN